MGTIIILACMITFAVALFASGNRIAQIIGVIISFFALIYLMQTCI